MINSFEINFVPQAPIEKQKKVGELVSQESISSNQPNVTTDLRH